MSASHREKSSGKPLRLKGSVSMTAAGDSLLMVCGIVLLVGALLEESFVLSVGMIGIGVALFDFINSVMILSALRRRRIRVHLADNVDQETFTAGTSYAIPLRLVLPHRLLLPFEFVVDVIASSAIRIRSDQRHSESAHGTQSDYRAVIEAERVGVHAVYGLESTFLSWLRLSYVKAYQPEHRSFYVVPDVGEMLAANRKRKIARGTLEGTSRSRDIGTHGLTRELREYRPGDSMRNIAWKQYARFNKPLVREFEREVSNSLLVGIDATALVDRRFEPAIARQLFSAFVRSIVEARERGDEVAAFAVWNRSSGTPIVQQVRTPELRSRSFAATDASQLLAQLVAPIEVSRKRRIARLVEILYRYERLDFRSPSARDEEIGTTDLMRSGNLHAKGLATWLHSELDASRWAMREIDSITARAWLAWGLCFDRLRAGPADLDGFEQLASLTMNPRRKFDRLEYFTVPFERVARGEFEEILLSERARSMEFAVRIAGATTSSKPDYQRPLATIAASLLKKAEGQAIERLAELGVDIDFVGTEDLTPSGRQSEAASRYSI